MSTKVGVPDVNRWLSNRRLAIVLTFIVLSLLLGWLNDLSPLFWSLLLVVAMTALAAAALSRKLLASQEARFSQLLQSTERNIASSQQHLLTDLNSWMVLNQRFPAVEAPLSSASMRPANISALIDLIQRSNAKLVVELGCGVSTVYLASCLKKYGNGRLVSFEHDPSWAEQCRFYLATHGLTEQAEIRVAPLTSCQCLGQHVDWYDLADQVGDLQHIDLLVVDGPPASVQSGARTPALESFYPLLNDTGVVFLDDGIRPGERRTVQQWLEAFPELEAQLYRSSTGYWLLSR